jgi:hypothetical protein
VDDVVSDRELDRGVRLTPRRRGRPGARPPPGGLGRMAGRQLVGDLAEEPRREVVAARAVQAALARERQPQRPSRAGRTHVAQAALLLEVALLDRA